MAASGGGSGSGSTRRPTITEDLIRARSSTFDLESVFSLSLASLDLRSLDGVLNQCTMMWNLDLADNKIESGVGLDGASLTKLRTLNLSNNLITTIGDMAALPTLENLYLQGNRISSLDELAAIPRKFPSLRSLYLKQIGGQLANPVCSDARYRERVLALLPTLQILDGERLNKKDFDLYKLSDEIRSKTLSAVTGSEEKLEGALTSLPPSTPWFTAQSLDLTLADDGSSLVAPASSPSHGTSAAAAALPPSLRPLASKIEGVRTAVAECRNLGMESGEMLRSAEARLAAALATTTAAATASSSSSSSSAAR